MNTTLPTPVQEVLLVDADPGDRALIAEAWNIHRLPARLHTASTVRTRWRSCTGGRRTTARRGRT